MKNILLLLVGIAWLSSTLAQQLENRKTYHDLYKTTVHEVYSVIKNTNTKHGEYKSYNGDGTIRVLCNYKNGKLDGTYMGYYAERKTLQEHYIYNNGDLVEQTEYWANGDKIYYKKINGIWTLYTKGVKSCDAFLYEGEVWGANNAYQPKPKDYYMTSGERVLKVKNCIYYYPSGKIAHEDKFNTYSISTESKSYTEDGQVTYERLLSEKDSTYTEKFFNNNKLYLRIGWKINITQGKYGKTHKVVREGLSLVYDDKGNPVSEGYYANDHRIGKWDIYYSYDSNLKRLTEEYDYSKADRIRSITYDDNGNPKGKVIDMSMATGEKLWEGYLISEQPDKYDGLNIFYYKGGEKEKEINYKNGTVGGVIKYYYQNGKVKEEQTILEVEDYTGEPSIINRTLWYESGQKKSESIYAEKEGETKYSQKIKYHSWIFYYENGNISKTGDYRYGYKDKEIGISKKYGEDGSLLTVSHYDNDGELLKTESGYKSEHNRQFDIIYGKKKYEEYLNRPDRTGGKFDEVHKKHIEGKQRILYNSYVSLFNSLITKFDNKSNEKESLKAGKNMIALCNKMLELLQQDTKELEKLLKKEKDPQKLLELFGI